TATSPLALQLQLTQLNVSGAAVRSATAPPLTIARDTAGEIIFSLSSRAQLSGAYQVTVTEVGLDDHSSDPAAAQLFAIATPVTGSADFPDDVDTLQFDAPAFRHLRATCISSSGACTVLLSDDAGWTASSPFGPDSSVTFRIDTPRRLFVSVTSELAGATWQVQLQDLAADDVGDTRTSALALPVDGMTRTFLFEAEGDVDVFKLTLNAGDIVWLTLNRFRLRVRSPNNAVSENRQFRATVAGDYLVEVFVENTATGPYQLTAQQGSDDFGNTIATAAPLASGVLINGRRDYTNDLDYFSIDVTAGQPVNAETSELCQLRLLSSTGSTLETSYEPVLWVPTATGRMYVVVGPCDEPTYALVATW
ncbi:MAG: hypothetical protein ACO1OB_34830, partial [Archangium sp.]